MTYNDLAMCTSQDAKINSTQQWASIMEPIWRCNVSWELQDKFRLRYWRLPPTRVDLLGITDTHTSLQVSTHPKSLFLEVVYFHIELYAETNQPHYQLDYIVRGCIRVLADLEGVLHRRRSLGVLRVQKSRKAKTVVIDTVGLARGARDGGDKVDGNHASSQRPTDSRVRMVTINVTSHGRLLQQRLTNQSVFGLSSEVEIPKGYACYWLWRQQIRGECGKGFEGKGCLSSHLTFCKAVGMHPEDLPKENQWEEHGRIDTNVAAMRPKLTTSHRGVFKAKESIKVLSRDKDKGIVSFGREEAERKVVKG
ncbi:hypothetical protein EV426DRAFT_702049 [Tirmania nivea]|nr:hypothetical protein EV426DRAFT_702049 [Tirmania nivea]